MFIPKTRHIYSAVAKAIDGFGNRHHINARSHLAPLLGFRGNNAHIQLSNTLNSTTYNPASPKRLSVDHLDTLLGEVDEIAKEQILSAMVEPHGFTLQRANKCTDIDTLGVVSLLMVVLNLDKKHGKLSEALSLAVEDEIIDEREREKLRDITSEFRTLLRSLEHMLQDEEEEL